MCFDSSISRKYVKILIAFVFCQTAKLVDEILFIKFLILIYLLVHLLNIVNICDLESFIEIFNVIATNMQMEISLLLKKWMSFYLTFTKKVYNKRFSGNNQVFLYSFILFYELYWEITGRFCEIDNLKI